MGTIKINKWQLLNSLQALVIVFYIVNGVIYTKCCSNTFSIKIEITIIIEIWYIKYKTTIFEICGGIHIFQAR